MSTADAWLLPLRIQLDLLKQEPGPLATNVRNLEMTYRIVGMMTEAEKAATVKETEQLLEELLTQRENLQPLPTPVSGWICWKPSTHRWMSLIASAPYRVTDSDYPFMLICLRICHRASVMTSRWPQERRLG